LLQTVKEIADVGADAGTGAPKLGLNLLELAQFGAELALLLRFLIQLNFEDGSRRLSIFCRTTPVPKLNDPIVIGSPAATAGTSREYPGVFALATLLAVTAISCWLTVSELSAIERDPNNPDMVILQPGAGLLF
jgi:hypothetical protein